MTPDFPASKANLRLIERSFPEGTIYTIYSLNLRHLFELEKEKELKDDIEAIKLKSKIITWIKARYLHKLFKCEHFFKCTHSFKCEHWSKCTHSFKCEHPEEYTEYVKSADTDIEEKKYKENIKDLDSEKYAQEKINFDGEVFYFRDERDNPVDFLGLSSKNPEPETLFDIFKLSQDKLKNLIESKEEGRKNLHTKTKEKIDNLYSQAKETFGEKSVQEDCKNVEINKIKKTLKELDDFHLKINTEKREKKRELYNVTRKAEKFLTSDEFGQFTKDPFFKITKNLERVIYINGEKCILQDVTTYEKKLLEDGHEFSIFRGHLKDKWLNSRTYKVKSKKVSYYIRLSKLGLLQIRKEEYLGTYKREFSGELNKEFEEALKAYQSENNLTITGNLDAETLEEMGIILSDSKRVGAAKIKEAQKILEAGNLIDVLSNLLNSQGRYSERSVATGNPDDILQVATGFARLLEFQTNSNYNRIFEGQKVSPLSIEKVRKKRTSLERQKYVVLFFTDIKKTKNSNESFQPLDLEQNFPEAISCILQGSLEKANLRESIKVFQYIEGIGETGNLDNITLKKMGIKFKKNQIKNIYSIYPYDKFSNKQREKIDKALEGTYVIPQISDSKEGSYTDVSTWKDELCIFSPERGFIFFNDKGTLESGNKIIRYEDYWKCIVRGIEYTVALRATIQLLESKTTLLLDSIPEILELSTSKDESANQPKKEADEKLKDLAEDLASILKTLPALRSIAIPTNAFRSGHSVKKYSYLYNECFNFEEIFKNIQKNIDELTYFLTYFQQQQETKEDRKLNEIALIFTITSIIYVSASFVSDLVEFLERKVVKGWISSYSLERFTISPEAFSIVTYIFILFILTLPLRWTIKRYILPKL